MVRKILALFLTMALSLAFVACDNNVGGGTAGGGNNTGGGNSNTQTIPIPNLPQIEENPVSDFEHSATNIGDIIEFGDYNWRVLDIQNGKALIISEDVIEYRPYHNEYIDVTWENSDLRAYLNGEFYNSFSEPDKARVPETTVINNDNPEYDTPGDNDTTDKVFLLGIDEANIYFANESSRICLDTNGEPAWWWLRSPGDGSYTAAYVRHGGLVNDYGHIVYSGNGDGGVRPALWLNL
ncbi:MAG: DUF6273 domain-containing protein [Oscillospiraceae bacterium]|nr:DUF6273 domain-containing protein [Oscillospiraceae bacterium]